MKINILTLFPDMFSPLHISILKRAQQAELIEINIVNIRDYSEDKHGKCDDTPFGGGAGMVMMAEPIYKSIMAIDPDHTSKRIYMSPKGKVLNVGMTKDLAIGGDITILCGHYEGIDQRIIDNYIDCEISIGDYILTGGELPAMVLVDSLSRYVDGVLGNNVSAEEESLVSGQLEHPQYTRPAVWHDISVPEVLLSGHHLNIEKWRDDKARELTEKMRPELIKNGN